VVLVHDLEQAFGILTRAVGNEISLEFRFAQSAIAISIVAHETHAHKASEAFVFEIKHESEVIDGRADAKSHRKAMVGRNLNKMNDW
jgi:hypothetical protein